MQPDPWHRPDQRQVARWRYWHHIALLVLGAVVIGWYVWPAWLKVPAFIALYVAVDLCHKVLDRRYDRMREEHRAV